MSRRYKGAATQLDLIKFLVEECGANVNCRDGEGVTALGSAAAAGHLSIAEYLMTKGAEPDPEGPDWTKPLTLAQHRGHTEIMKALSAHLSRQP
jgi:ankyrin repeat protein